VHIHVGYARMSFSAIGYLAFASLDSTPTGKIDNQASNKHEDISNITGSTRQARASKQARES
jgi:hypothetical protein